MVSFASAPADGEVKDFVKFFAEGLVRSAGKTLQRLSFHLQEEEYHAVSDWINCRVAYCFLEGAAKFAHKGLLPELRVLIFSMPWPISLLAEGLEGQDGKGSRKIRLEQSSSSQRKDHERPVEVMEASLMVLTLITQFVGRDGLKEVDLSSGSFVEGNMTPEQVEAFCGLLEGIGKSFAVLEVLKLEIEVNSAPAEALDLVVKCPNLSKLSLCFNFRGRWGWGLKGRKSIRFSESFVQSHLRDLELDLNRLDWDWNLDSDNISKWIGSDLERLSIKSNEKGVKISNQMIKKILTANQSLISVVLDTVPEVEPQFLSSQNQISLPNLLSLQLSPLQVSNCLFNETSFPQLKSFSIVPKIDDSKVEEQPVDFKGFLSLPLVCKSALDKLKPKAFNQVDHDVSKDQELLLPRLELLDLSDAPEVGEQWKTIEAFNLKSLHLPSSSSSIQAILKHLKNSSGSLQKLTTEVYWQWHSNDRTAELALAPIPQLKIQHAIPFESLKHLQLEGTMVGLLTCLTGSYFNKLEELSLSLDCKVLEKLEIGCEDLTDNLFSMFNSSSTSLLVLKVNTFRQGGKNDFKGFFQECSVDQRPAIVFSNLESLLVNNKIDSLHLL